MKAHQQESMGIYDALTLSQTSNLELYKPTNKRSMGIAERRTQSVTELKPGTAHTLLAPYTTNARKSYLIQKTLKNDEYQSTNVKK